MSISALGSKETARDVEYLLSDLRNACYPMILNAQKKQSIYNFHFGPNIRENWKMKDIRPQHEEIKE